MNVFCLLARVERGLLPGRRLFRRRHQLLGGVRLARALDVDGRLHRDGNARRLGLLFAGDRKRYRHPLLRPSEHRRRRSGW